MCVYVAGERKHNSSFEKTGEEGADFKRNKRAEADGNTRRARRKRAK